MFAKIASQQFKTLVWKKSLVRKLTFISVALSKDYNGWLFKRKGKKKKKDSTIIKEKKSVLSWKQHTAPFW